MDFALASLRSATAKPDLATEKQAPLTADRSDG